MPAPSFEITELSLPGAMVIRGPLYADDRGYFAVTSNRHEFKRLGINDQFIQDNQSLSLAAGTIRGLHYQLPPFAQAKLVRVLAGSILDVIVDARVGSPTYGKYSAVDLSAKNCLQVYAPRGFLHGFMTLEPNTIVLYKVDNAYAPGHDRSVRWDDPDLAIQWPSISPKVIVSDKDLQGIGWTDMGSPFTFGQNQADSAL
jgi:dTDP-4-dehydrorhamnose 3,5-epimerase